MFCQEELQERIARTKESVMVYIKEYRNNICEEIEEPFAHLIKRAGRKQVKYMVISFLYSSYLTDSRKYSLNLYNDLFYLDPSNLHESIYFRFLDSYFDKDFKYLTDFIGKKYMKLTAYEIIALRIECGKWYMDVLHYCLSELIQCITRLDCFQKINRTPDFKIILGEYMDKGVEIHNM